MALALLLADALGVAAALGLAYYLRIGSGLLPYRAAAAPLAYARLGLLVLPVWLAIFALCRLYDPALLLGGPEEYGQVVVGCSFGTLALVMVGFLEHTSLPSRLWLLLALALSVLLVGAARFGLRRAAYALRRRGLFVSRAVIVGTDEQARSIARQFEPAARHGVEIIGFVDDFKPQGTAVAGRLRVLGAPSALFDLARRLQVHQVIVVPGALAWESLHEILQQASTAGDGPQIQIAPGFYEIMSSSVRVTYRGYVPLLTVEMSRLVGPDALLKAALDGALAAAALPIGLPLMAAIALALKLLRAPRVLLHPRVLGRGGRAFAAPVFWSPQGGEEPCSRAARRFGALLYRSGLSKLPQLFCVLRGRMSMVGPRPVGPEAAAAYGRWLPNRLMVKPGLTGPWVPIDVDHAPLEEEIRLDMYYVRNWTIWLDLQILFQTAMGMLHLQRGRPRRAAAPGAAAAAAEGEAQVVGQAR